MDSERSDNQLSAMAHVRHPLSTMLRQYMALQAIEGLKLTHTDLLHSALSGTTTNALLVKGSATLPPSLRRAGDLDITVSMDNSKYNPAVEKAALKPILQPIAQAMHADLHMVQDQEIAGKQGLDRLRTERIVAELENKISDMLKADYHANREGAARIKRTGAFNAYKCADRQAEQKLRPAMWSR